MNDTTPTPSPAGRETPRTDVLSITLPAGTFGIGNQVPQPVVSADFARTLERELAEAKAQLLENLRIQSSREDRFREEGLMFARRLQDAEARLSQAEKELSASKARESALSESVAFFSTESSKYRERCDRLQVESDDLQAQVKMDTESFRARAELCDELAEALNKISDLQTRWPGWNYQDLYEESQEIAGPVIAKHAAAKNGGVG